MNIIITILCIYGLCFGLQNKATFLRGHSDLLDELLNCTYCLGFHCGWLFYIFNYFLFFKIEELNILQTGFQMTCYGFFGASTTYLIDTAIRWIESQIEIEEEYEE
jgi:hypothetical protein